MNIIPQLVPPKKNRNAESRSQLFPFPPTNTRPLHFTPLPLPQTKYFPPFRTISPFFFSLTHCKTFFFFPHKYLFSPPFFSPPTPHHEKSPFVFFQTSSKHRFRYSFFSVEFRRVDSCRRMFLFLTGKYGGCCSVSKSAETGALATSHVDSCLLALV